MSDAELDEFERLIDLPDPDLYAALTGARPLPAEFEGAMFERMRDFRPADGL
jgi:antitoxin CptB